MEEIALFIAQLVLQLAGDKPWLAVVVPVLLLLVSEILPFFAKIPSSGILHSIYLGAVALLKKIKELMAAKPPVA